MRGSKRRINVNKLCVLLIVVFVCIIGLSVAYAALSSTLTISGNAEVQAANWNVYFYSASGRNPVQTTGDATYTLPVVNGTTLSDYSVSLTKPGDSVTFTYYIANDSDYSALVESITHSTPICTSATGNKEDEKLVCDNLLIEFSGNVEFNMHIGNKKFSDRYFICYEGKSKSVSPAFFDLKISYNGGANALSSSNVTVTNLRTDIVLIPHDLSCEYGDNVVGQD